VKRENQRYEPCPKELVFQLLNQIFYHKKEKKHKPSTYPRKSPKNKRVSEGQRGLQCKRGVRRAEGLEKCLRIRTRGWIFIILI